MNENTAAAAMTVIRRRNRPLAIALTACCGVAMIYIDSYLQASLRSLAQQLTWSTFDLGYLFIFIRPVLRRRRLWFAAALTILLQGYVAYLLSPLFPLSNSLALLFPGVAGILFLGVAFALLARLIDPGGPRPLSSVDHL